MEHIGNNIKSIIFKSIYSAKDISEKLGVSYQYLYKIFNSENVDTKYLFKLAEILDIPVTAFFPEESANWNNKELISEVTRLDIRNQDLMLNIKHLDDIIRTKRSLLRLIYENLKNTEDDGFNQIIKAINDSEKFDPEIQK